MVEYLANFIANLESKLTLRIHECIMTHGRSSRMKPATRAHL